MMTIDDEGGGGLANDDAIKNFRIYRIFLKMFFRILQYQKENLSNNSDSEI